MGSYKTCEQCKVRVFQDEQGKFICPKCGKEIKSQTKGWGSN